jgi:succinoglycan biosynthesis protein ExoA
LRVLPRHRPGIAPVQFHAPLTVWLTGAARVGDAVAPQGKQFVSIVMPALDEERYIADAIASIVPDASDLEYELLVLDGGSTDRTRAIVAELAATNPRIRVIHNAKRIQSAGVNLAARFADPRAAYLVRADCHIRYPVGFVQRCVKDLSNALSR